MPPRKRKAPPKLKTVVESPVKEEEPQQAPQVELQESPDNAGNVLSKIDDEGLSCSLGAGPRRHETYEVVLFVQLLSIPPIY